MSKEKLSSAKILDGTIKVNKVTKDSDGEPILHRALVSGLSLEDKIVDWLGRKFAPKQYNLEIEEARVVFEELYDDIVLDNVPPKGRRAIQKREDSIQRAIGHFVRSRAVTEGKCLDYVKESAITSYENALFDEMGYTDEGDEEAPMPEYKPPNQRHLSLVK